MKRVEWPAILVQRSSEETGMGVSDKAAKGIMDWAKGQPFNNILILAQLGILCFLGWYGLTAVIPEERKAILDGALKIEEHHTQQVKEMSQTYEAMLDRIADKDTKSRKVAQP